MGINELPEIHDNSFWSTNDHLHYFPVASQFPKTIYGVLHLPPLQQQ